jgi:hypothetical protein
MDQKIHLIHALAAVTELGQCLCVAAALMQLVALLVLAWVEEGSRDEVGSYHELTHITVDLYYAIGQEGFIMNNPYNTDNAKQ